jgi:hypothetical protein
MNGITYWLGELPVRCDLCSQKIQDIGEFMDARTKMGMWGTLCPKCHDRYGVGLGPGRGQHYKRTTDQSGTTRYRKQPPPPPPRPPTALEKMTRTTTPKRRKSTGITKRKKTED